jgi:DNA modification methylase
MKYWGKKPHNIWATFIKNYCPPSGFVLDPFVGSGMAAFEAVRLGRKALAFDLNPLTSFLIEVLSSEFDENKFLSAANSIDSKLQSDPVYLAHYTKNYEGKNAVVYNYRWLSKEVDKVTIETSSGARLLVPADSEDKKKAVDMQKLLSPYWYPQNPFPQTPSIKHKFIKDVGGSSFDYLWTKRNLYLLSRIFEEINIASQSDEDLKKQLLLGFIHTLHLTSKMVVYRAPSANRDFSGSWGRADYMIRRKSMEQNPVIVFMRSCTGKQSVLSALTSARSYLPKNIKLSDITETKKIKKTADINYGVLDIADLSDVLDEKSVDFVITDPPYAGLVYYLDLSLIWLVWLQKINSKYIPDLNSEITIKKGQISRQDYQRKLDNAFRQIRRVLKDDSYLVVTFHHKKTIEWNSFINAVRLAGFKVDKVLHQYNRRSGESNVANPYGTSGSDFYIRLVKHRDVDFSNNTSGLQYFVVQKAIQIIAERNEPTPYSFIVQGVIPEMIQAGYVQPEDYQQEISSILSAQVGPSKKFTVRKNEDNKAGDYWWFVNPHDYIKYPNRPLNDRLEETVLSILRKKIAVKFDDVLGELFQTYPNGLLPHQKSVKSVLEKYAYQSAGKWKLKDEVLRSVNRHTEIIRKLAVIGRAITDNIVYIGKREYSEPTIDWKKLSDYADISSLNCLEDRYNAEKISRLEMIDIVWLSKTQRTICFVFEVEHTTGFTSAIQRASNAEANIPKIMVIPNEREVELRKIKDPLFLSAFQNNGWRYVTYDDVERVFSFSQPSLESLLNYAKTLNTEASGPC